MRRSLDLARVLLAAALGLSSPAIAHPHSDDPLHDERSSASARSDFPGSTRTCDVAREYVRLMDERRYDQVGDLWADDAVFFSPMGKIVRGKAEISAFYARFLRQITPVNRIASLTWDRAGNVCVMELETRVTKGADGKWMPDPNGDFHSTAIDRFVVNDAGKVQQMRVYLAPSDPWLPE